MSKKILILVFICILIFPLSLTAKERRGAELRVFTKDGRVVEGELITVKQNSLLLLSHEGVDVSCDVKDIMVIIIDKKSKALLGAGLVYGITTICFTILSVVSVEGEYSFLEALPWIMLCNIPWAIAGAAIGAAIGTDKTIQIEGKTYSEIKEAMDYLRSKARVPNNQ